MVTGSGDTRGIDFCALYIEASKYGRLDAYRSRKWGRHTEFADWLQQSNLESLAPDQALAMYRASGGRDVAAFRASPIEEIRDSLDFLLYDNIKLEGRFEECAGVDGGYFLPGAGKEFISYLLCVANPDLLGVWNANSERLLRRMGASTQAFKQGPIGVRYVDFMECLRQVRGRLGFADYRMLDELAYLASRPKGFGAHRLPNS